jgi:hypothetical protein
VVCLDAGMKPAAVVDGIGARGFCRSTDQPREERKVCHAVRMARTQLLPGAPLGLTKAKLNHAVRMARTQLPPGLPPGLTNAKLNELRRTGDPVADRAVDAVFEGGGVNRVNEMLQKLVRVDQPVPEDLPPEVQEYLVETLRLPGWADMDKIERGQRLWASRSFEITLCLFCASLPSSYAAAKAVQVLNLTAQMDTNTRRRVMETGQFLFDVLAVGSLDEDGKGLRTIQKVRLMHAAVRRLIEIRSEQRLVRWEPAWGKPINQEDLAGTLLAFWYVVTDPMSRLGVDLPDEEKEAYLHLWNVIGHQLGLCDELRMNNLTTADALVDAIRRRQFKASPEGQAMTRALLVLLDQLTPGHLFDDTIPPLIRRLIGDKTADMVRVPQSNRVGGLLERTFSWFYVGVFGRDRRDSERFELNVPFAQDLLRAMFELERGGERAPFAMPDHLAQSLEPVNPPSGLAGPR